MKQHDEKIYRKSPGKPTLDALRSQLTRLRQDYERFAGKDLASDLKRTLEIKIAGLEAEIAESVRAANAAAAAEEDSRDNGPDETAKAPHTAAVMKRGAGTRSIPPRFRALRK